MIILSPLRRLSCTTFYAIALCLSITAWKTVALSQLSLDTLVKDLHLYRSQGNAPSDSCRKDETQVKLQGLSCRRTCTSDSDCRSTYYTQSRCMCDGVCGWSCIEPDSCSVPAIENGVVTAGKTSYAYVQPGTNVPHGKTIGIECDQEYEPVRNTTSAVCNNGTWAHQLKCQPAFCKFPGSILNGRIVLIKDNKVYAYRNYLNKVENKGKIIFECDNGFELKNGPREKTCTGGKWTPQAKNDPKCVSILSTGLHSSKSNRRNRRAIKPGGSSVMRAGGKGGPGGGGTSPRRGSKKRRPGDDDDLVMGIPICDDLNHDPYIQTEVVQPGKAENQTFSAGAIVKVSCAPGFGVNLPNETVICADGRWKPKIPQCSALPCKTPYLIHGTFYNGTKALVFQESVKHTNSLELRCSKGFVLRGPKILRCWFGSWDVSDAPECVPAPCVIPQSNMEHQINANGHRAGSTVVDGTEVDYTCSSELRKSNPGVMKCNLGEWKPDKPLCPRKSVDPNDSLAIDSEHHASSEGRKRKLKRSCNRPPKEVKAIVYLEGIPIFTDHRSDFSFPNGTEITYRCAPVKPKMKNRWKLRCEDGKWVGNTTVHHCEGNPDTQLIIEELMKMVNSSCVFRKEEKYIATFFEDKEIASDYEEFPSNTILTYRCIDIGKYKLYGADRRKCLSGQWFGVAPKCEGLSQYHDYGLDKSPTILFRYVNGSIVQSNDGKLVVYPGTTLHMECLWIRKFGTPKWEVSNTHRVYQEGWTDEEGRDSALEYRLTIDNAQPEDSGPYSCSTPARHSHKIHVIVKSVECKPLPQHHDLKYSTNSTLLGTNVTFECQHNNALVGAQYIVCGFSGLWSAELPRCENVECPDISLLPAMAPLQNTSLTKNGTLKKNETSPPKITIVSRAVGGKAKFACPDGFTIQGSPEATCLNTGSWSTNIALCKEIECTKPSPPDHGLVAGNDLLRYKAGDIAQFECDQGYMMEGQSIVACQDNGSWSRSSSTAKCVSACTYPGTIIGGTISQVKFYYAFEESVTFDCTDGYPLRGASKLVCMKNGKWSNSVPTCGPRPHNNDHMNNDHISGIESFNYFFHQ